MTHPINPKIGLQRYHGLVAHFELYIINKDNRHNIIRSFIDGYNLVIRQKYYYTVKSL